MIKVSLYFTSLFILLFYISIFLNVIAKPSLGMNGTITIGVIYENQPQRWTRQQILQTTLNRLKLGSPVLRERKFLFHYVNGSNFRSMNHCLELISEQLLQQDVHNIIITLDDSESQLLSQWASLIDIPVLGTSRNINLENKVGFCFKYKLI